MTDKKEYRQRIFQHLDGLVTAPSAFTLFKKNICSYILDTQHVTLSELSKQFKTNEGYLNIALRTLASQGFLEYKVDNVTNVVTVETNEKSAYAFSLFPLYEDVVRLLEETQLFTSVRIATDFITELSAIFSKYKNNFGITFSSNETERSIQQQILVHIEGFLVGPIVVSLGMTGMFHKYFMEISFRAEEFHREPQVFKVILDFFTFLGWFTEKNGNYQFTDVGLFFAKRATAYGVTVSYLPLFKNLETLLFGNPNSLRDIAKHEDEIHVNREMNVWGSGGAHATYFKVIDDIIIELFNKPINEQPKGILDMGCGNGAFLQHIFEVIERQTLRGKILEDHPLFLVGADYNQAALKVTRANLIKADIWAKVIWGDIGRPDLLANDLAENYNIDLKDLLNVRTFLDHNRIWEEPQRIKEDRISVSTGAFAHRGERISNNRVEDNLLQHLTKWSPYVQKYGLLIIELHTVSPKLTAANLGKTAATAYDATHGFSDQFIVEIDVLHNVAAEAGLFPDPVYFKKFPDTAYAIVSINLLKG
ncbi:class I SAM-dependent methyltransferase [Flavobacterium jejuense]|uniref:Class I SAM-dependent methyltransferase n=1 Tax=Flavobacterium jejuense TaxID=1544455 RepID=A0ABX0IMU0_9FLAO|nr:class I SAM-dependent methyltransferase [Flavobacterium jejuense]NHN24903.1 class I SAM-dependent methyltransferase [Flavobacterium jejuense]